MKVTFPVLWLFVAMLGLLQSAELSFVQKEGYRFAEAKRSLNGTTFRIWVYAPAGAPAGKRPCVIVPPAGSPLLFGMEVGEGDSAEHLPYVKKGDYVVSFDIVGARAEGMTTQEVGKALRTFYEAGMGVDQMPIIMSFIKEQLLEVDPAAIYMAGHSSAGTFVLQASQAQDGLAGVMAYCPVVDVEARLDAVTLAGIRKMIPRYKDGFSQVNPSSGVARTKCKVFLFGSKDDQNARLEDIEAFAKKLTAAKIPVTLLKGTGSHYDSMMEQGIPAGIAWTQK